MRGGKGGGGDSGGDGGCGDGGGNGGGDGGGDRGGGYGGRPGGGDSGSADACLTTHTTSACSADVLAIVATAARPPGFCSKGSALGAAPGVY